MSGLRDILDLKLLGFPGLFNFSSAVCQAPQRSSLSLASTGLASSTLSGEKSEHSQLEEEDVDFVPEDATMHVSMPKPSQRVPVNPPSGTGGNSGDRNAVPPNVGIYEPLSSLRDEFKFNKHFGQKVTELAGEGYHGWRRIRGDGNCFYRAFGFGLLEQIILAPPKQQMAWAACLQAKLHSLTFEDASEQYAHTRLVHHVGRLTAGQSWQEASGLNEPDMTCIGLLFVSFCDSSVESLDLAMVRALRRLTARCMLDRADDWETCNGISFRMLCEAQGLGTPEDFCRKVISPMGVEAESLVMNAIVPALETPLRLALLDRGDASGLVFEDYTVAGKDTSELPRVHLQLRPGHYDLLYWRDSSADTLSPTSIRRQRPVTFGMDGGNCLWELQQPNSGDGSSEASTLPHAGGGYRHR